VITRVTTFRWRDDLPEGQVERVRGELITPGVAARAAVQPAA